MLYIRQSNRPEKLAEWAATAFREGITHPLGRQAIVVQNTGMATWLNYHYAKKHGVSAGGQFFLPGDLFWQLVTKTIGTSRDHAFTREAMHWHLFKLLSKDNQELWQADCSEALKAYLQEDQEGRKRFALADWIADVFDQYLIYRPEWMLAWRQKQNKVAGGDADWQAMLWRMLGENCIDGPDRAQFNAQAKQLLGSGDRAAVERVRAWLGERLYIFGLSALAPEQVDLIRLLSRHIDVQIYLFNPCQAYWADLLGPQQLARKQAKTLAQGQDESHLEYFDHGHPLLTALGYAGAGLIDALIALTGGEEALLEDDFELPGEACLLHRLQQDILTNRQINEADIKPLIAEQDRSIQLANCHSPMRELEALKDWLLLKIADDPTLKPRDIVVMIPDIDDYAPYIKTVFNAPAAGGHIPYSLCDYSQHAESSRLGLLIRLLRLINSQLAVSEVLDLLEAPAVMQALGLNQEQLPRLHQLIYESGIRWGRDRDHWRESLDIPPQTPIGYTWENGLSRMMVNYSMGADSEPFRHYLPMANMTIDQDPVWLALLNFIAVLDKYRNRLTVGHKGWEWAELIGGLAQDLRLGDHQPDDADNPKAYWGNVSGHLNWLKTLAMEEEISLDVLCQWLEEQKQSNRMSHRFLTGNVTFCTLVPMRNIPFRVVALVGMNEGSLPRQHNPVSFNLMNDLPRAGDHNRREEGLYLFLEALMAARDHLYISWNGRIKGSLKPCPPAVVVTSLEDLIRNSFARDDGKDIVAQLTLEHPLQPFSHKYHAEGLVTYSKLWAGGQLDEPKAPKLTLEFDHQRVSLEALSRFYCGPAETFLRQHFDLSAPGRKTLLLDSEPFEVAGLDNYTMMTQALRLLLLGSEKYQRWLDDLRWDSRIPFGPMGQAMLEELDKNIAYYQSQIEGLPASAQIELKALVNTEIGRCEVYGKLACIGRGRLVLRAGKAKAKDWMRLWIGHLLLSSQPDRISTPQTTEPVSPLAQSLNNGASILIDAETDHSLLPMDSTEAKEELKSLLEIRQIYLHQKPIPLTVESACAGVQKASNREVEISIYRVGDPFSWNERAAQKAWEPDPFQPAPSESEHWANRRLWPELDLKDIEHWSKKVWTAIHRHLMAGKKAGKLDA